MQYTSLGSTGLRVSRLGFGTMRLPMADNGKVDRRKSTPLLRRAVDLGVNYFDSAIFYCNADSQAAVGEALQPVRDKVILATKNHMHSADAAAWQQQLEDSLRMLRTDQIDLYHLHGLSWAAYESDIAGAHGKLQLMLNARQAGKIRHICCSFHDNVAALIKLIETRHFDSILLQYNLLDRSLEPGITRAHELGIGIVVMGPVGGGRLGVASENLRALTNNQVDSTPEAALRFVLANAGVQVALSGMSSIEMLEQNVAIVANKPPFTAAEVAALQTEVERVRQARGAACTACGYCMPCGFGVDIARNLQLFNDECIYGLGEVYRRQYAKLAGKAARCVDCGACLAKCPQKLAIPAVLRQTMRTLEPELPPVDLGIAAVAAPAGQVRCRLTLRNLTAKACCFDAALELSSGSIEPCRFTNVALPAWGAQAVTATAELAPDQDAIRGLVQFSNDSGIWSRPLALPLTIAPAATARRHAVQLSVANVADDKRRLAISHNYLLNLAHTADFLTVEVLIHSQLQALATPKNRQGSRFDLYVDMRPLPELATANFSAGIDIISISLTESVFWTRSGQSYDLNLSTIGTDDGCTLRLRLPFAQFGCRQIPRRIGFDTVLVVADTQRRPQLNVRLGGENSEPPDPATFARCFLLE